MLSLVSIYDILFGVLVIVACYFGYRSMGSCSSVDDSVSGSRRVLACEVWVLSSFVNARRGSVLVG